jgi:hypothetical protein
MERPEELVKALAEAKVCLYKTSAAFCCHTWTCETIHGMDWGGVVRGAQ